MSTEDWLLDADERGNPVALDPSWTSGNDVRPLIHGRTYFAELLAGIRRLAAGDYVFFTDWRGDPDERLDGPDTEIAQVLSAAAERGVVVKGLIWRSHLDKLYFSRAENRHLGTDIERAGGEGLLDMRVRPGGCHHQKLVVLRHRDRPDLDVAYVGGIDLCHSRNDDATHAGDPQPVAMSGAYGRRPPWHDAQAAIRGPAVAQVDEVFRQRWTDPAPLTRNPVARLHDLFTGGDDQPGPLPPRPAVPRTRGTHTVQLLRTYPPRGYPFAPDGERSIARGYQKALRQARDLIYLEDQYLWSDEVAASFAEALRDRPGLRMIAVVPPHPDMTGVSALAQNAGRARALARLRAAGGDRFAVYSLENHAGTPIYVHAKVCVIDDTWATIGSDNFNRRSWTHDSELSCAVLDDAGAYARNLRLALAAEHLDRAAADDHDLIDAKSAFEAFRRAAAALDRWYADGRHGDRPAGRLRAYVQPPVRRRWLASLLYRTVTDPDARPRGMRRTDTY
ncbi:phospholipase D family protein [Hamadaea tsunoensis]|uniref:phospholipase D family protein n=1 Tax=Hamadaea tsunoensis TaxID=53368 RepID=UPI000481A974|nr:phospholipase D family protein [Hamadaea tsunoensis]